MTGMLWLSLLFVCLLGAMSPGPSLVIVAQHTLASGRKQGVLTAWAHALGIGFYALLTLMGLALLIEAHPTAFRVVSYAGAAYLIWLGIGALRSTHGIGAKLAAGKPAPWYAGMRDGLAISLLSPKIILFFTALFSQFVSPSQGQEGAFLIVMTPWVVDGLWYTLIACLLSHPKFLPWVRRRAVMIDRLSGIILIALALRVLMGS
ncbi:Threonine efflux protein [Vibrio stylophorae]|uniref:Threonine efflux protein n=1 Tax=Vibrio stylophorae TaxID=659351 RepID=A0ABM8ZQD9_9VIBR|nr:LysE family translocator [Vibrio stylophorae]CAH0532413.1 Threonine efflux protein [Vibrio stylophorae]